MSESAQYPVWFGRAIKLAFDLRQNPRLNPEGEIKAFVERLVAGLPPPGTLLEEVCGSRTSYFVRCM